MLNADVWRRERPEAAYAESRLNIDGNQLGVWDSQQPLDKLIIAEGVETALAAAQLCGGIPLTREGPFIPGTKIAAIATTGGYQHGQCRAAGGEGVHYLRRQ